ncbi:hypothetical protein K488DRAFT_73507 [Vararia minispora EC-137]|uniref:Uncharacterized protein n=1 Tax=Vararia minispora EC-137 TaxID=1314806 RepID=A0ACB8QAK6_9AGAM|nr:hypothetical protein K488DRAFT_73507 [Vararia minispora EC-137]
MPTGNTVVSTNINVDGTLTLAKFYSTGGFGQHGNDGVNGSDPLFSQGSLQVNPATGLLGVVNSGSNTVSLFHIDPKEPSTLTQVGSSVATGGEFPVSLSFNDVGNMLCVLNAGFVNGIQCYGVDAKTGLSLIPGSWRPLNMNVTTPPAGPLGTASQVIFTADQQNVIAAIKGNPKANITGYLASWSLNGTALSSAYTRVELPAGAGAPFSIGSIPGQNALFSTDAAVGAAVYDLSGGPASAFASPATKVLAIPGQKAICWQAYSNVTKNFYVTDFLSSTITEVNVSSNLTASMVKQYDTLPGAAPVDNGVATFNGTDSYLYTLLANATSVHVMSLGAPGQASLVQVMDIAQAMTAANVPFNAQNLQGMAIYTKP